MVDDIIPEDPSEDIIVIEPSVEDFVVLDFAPTDEVIVAGGSSDVVILESAPSQKIVFADDPNDSIVIEQEFSDDIIVSLSQGPPGPEGPQGPEGPIGPSGTHVVDMEIQGVDLVSTLSDGSQINAGEIPVGPAESPSQTFSFASASELWVCEHNFGRRAVQVVTYDSSGEEIFGDVHYVNDNIVEIRWYYATSGTAQITK